MTAASDRLSLVWAAPVSAAQDGLTRGGRPPDPLVARFEGELAIRIGSGRPTIVANFVSSLDGVVALGPRAVDGGSAISGGAPADRLLMAMLRSLADVVVVGAGTARAAARHIWTPAGIDPPSSAATAAWRANLGLAPQPTTVIVTASGWYDEGHPGLVTPSVPVLVATTITGRDRLARRALPAHVRVAALGDEQVTPAALVDILRDVGAKVALCEGGPHLLGELLAAGLLDELFLTLAPHVLGRVDAPGEANVLPAVGAEAEGTGRLGLVEGVAFAPGDSPWAELRAVRRSGDHLFLRYAFPGGSSA